MQTFLARQPIFRSDRNVYGYELLFRRGRENSFDGSPLDLAAAFTADNLFLFGIDRLTNGRRAFFNCTRDFLLRDFRRCCRKIASWWKFCGTCSRRPM